MFVVRPSAGGSAECCVILTSMAAPRSRALVFLNIGCGRQKIQTGGLNEERAAQNSLHSNCSSTRSLGIALKLVAKEDTMKPTVCR